MCCDLFCRARKCLLNLFEIKKVNKFLSHKKKTLEASFHIDAAFAIFLFKFEVCNFVLKTHFFGGFFGKTQI